MESDKGDEIFEMQIKSLGFSMESDIFQRTINQYFI